jgi:signal transduction histidine kinase
MNSLRVRLYGYLEKLHLPNKDNKIQRYGLVILLVFIYFSIKTATVVILGSTQPFLFALFVVIIAAWFGGFGPGIIASLLTGTVLYVFFLEPNFPVWGEKSFINVIFVGIFFIQGVLISILSESHRKNDVQKTEFVGIISHELKSPLTSIKGYTDLIKYSAEKKKDKHIVEIARKVDNQVRQLTDMINEMLDITTIETGRLTYHDNVFKFTDLLKERVDDYQVTTETHKIILLGKTAKKIYGDKYRIGQVINNLLSNAIKYSPKAKKIEVFVKNYPGGIEIHVRDFGPGIEKNDQRNVFKPFLRLKKTEAAKGTGIGLFITSQIVQRHNGKIWVESSPGNGSVFCVQLPSKHSKLKS